MTAQRIALVLHESPAARPGGVELYVLALARALMRLGFAAECVHPLPLRPGETAGPRTAAVQGVPFTAFPAPLKPTFESRHHDPELGAALAAFLAGRGASVVHVHHLIGFSGAVIPACKDAGLPVVMTVHDAWFHCNQCHYVRWDGALCAEAPPGPEVCARCLLERVPHVGRVYPLEVLAGLMAGRTRSLVGALGRADRLLANSRYTRRNLLRAGLAREKVACAPLGVAGFAPLPRVPRAAGAPLRVGCLGGLGRAKGQDVLVRAVRRLAPGLVQAHIHGGCAGRDFARELEPLLDTPGVVWHGRYGPADLPRILAGLDVVVQPSRAESFGLAVREAFLAGVPVLASRVAALEEAVAEGRGGLLFPPGDDAALAGLLERLAGEPGLAAALAAGVPPVRTIDEDARFLARLYARLAAPGGAGG
jgi:glycosyltransferase involved in cell wall biosynthesis